MEALTLEAWIVVGIIISALILFVTEWLSVDLIALMIVVALVVTGVLGVDEGLSGFSNPATLTVAFMFAISAALLKTGVMQLWGPKLSRLLKHNYYLGMLGLMLAVAVSSAFVNNTPVVAVFIPVVLQVAKSTGIPSSKMLIPLSFASILGGMSTLLGTSTNILVNGIAEDHGIDSIGLFAMTPVAAVMGLAGLAYFALIGFRLLPVRKAEGDWKAAFGAPVYLSEVEITAEGKAHLKSIMNLDWVKDFDIDIVEIRRNGNRFNMPAGDMVLAVGDKLKLRCDAETLGHITALEGLKLNTEEVDDPDDTVQIELVVTSNSSLEGKSLRQLDFRRKYRAIPLAIRHREAVYSDDLHDIKLQAGDVILARAKSHYLKQIKRAETEEKAPFAMLSAEDVNFFNRPGFFKVLGIMMAMITAAALGVPVVLAALIALVALVLTRSLAMKEVYTSINWNVVFLLAGALSLGIAMEKTGLAETLAGGLILKFGDLGPVWILASLYAVTAILTEIMSNTASAAVMAPLAISISNQLEMSPMPFLIGIMLAASASFLTPIGYQTNAMIYGAGQYKFTDFTRTGLGLSLIVGTIAVWLIPKFFPF